MRIGGFRRVAASMATGVMVATLAVGCGGDDPPRDRAEPSPVTELVASTTSPSTTTTTTEATTTTIDPDAPVFEPLMIDPALAPEAQVEAAYLHHWDVLMDAYRTGRTDSLDLVYTGEALTMRVAEINGILADGVRVGGHVEHNYAITIHNDTEATLIDGFWNYLVDTDPESGEPVSEASGEQIAQRFQYVKEGDQWLIDRVVLLEF